MKYIKIDPANLFGWEAFHTEMQKVFDFPSYYGRNMDAWIDCMDEFTEELTVLDLGRCQKLKAAHPKIMEALFECAAFVNFRRVEAGDDPVLIIAAFA